MAKTLRSIDFMDNNSKPDELLAVEITILGEPQSKRRARYVRRTGRAYTPKETRSAEEAIGWLVKQAAPGIQPNKKDSFAVELQFFCQSYHRRDIDNMTKLVFDACNKLVWNDDSQVERLNAELVRASDNPRTHIRISSFPSSIPYKECIQCGKPVRLHPSWGSRKYCSRECCSIDHQRRVLVPCANCGKENQYLKGDLARPGNKFCNLECKTLALTVLLTCVACRKEFRRPRSWVKGKGRGSYCTKLCMDEFFANRKKNRGGNCPDCGARKSKKNYEHCKSCSIAPRNADGTFVPTRGESVTSQGL